MATLISPGVSVTVIDESFFFPVTATTVPLIFLATRSGKLQPDGVSLAAGTLESNVVRTVTSTQQSLELYGIPYFHNDISGNEFHGDARNEYGLLALNSFLGQGNRAYVVRANVNLDDEPETFISLGVPVSSNVSFVGIGNGTIGPISATSSTVKPQTITVTFTSSTEFGVSGTVNGYITAGVVGTPVVSNAVNFTITAGAVPFVAGDKFTFSLVYTAQAGGGLSAGPVTVTGVGNGTVTNIVESNQAVAPQTFTLTFTSPTVFTVSGSVDGALPNGSTTTPYTSSVINFVVTVGGTPFVAGDVITFAMAANGPNVGNGTIVGLVPDTLAVEEVITIQFQTPTSFTVSNLFGPAGFGTVNTPYDDGRLNFTIVPGTTPFVAGDEFTVTATEVTINAPLGTSDAQKRLTIVTALQAAVNSNIEVRSELYEYNLILCPGYFELSEEMVALASDVKEEALVLCDTPVTLNPDQTAQWALTSERQSKNTIAYYYPWALQSNLDGRNVLGAPSGVALRTITNSDEQSFVWFAPAGVSRGLTFNVARVGYITGTLGTPTTFVEANLNEGQRDNLYEYFKNINPIVFFPGRGILIWGQKTSAPAASALDRINVVRMVMYLRRVLRKGALPFVFEPNDQVTRDNLKAAADSVMNDILIKRGLTDYASYCDATNNTPDRIDRNELYLDIAIKPTRAAEFIYIPIRVVATSATI